MNVTPEERQLLDSEHLRLLRLGYFISAATTAFFGSFGLFYAFMGFVVGSMVHNAPKTPGPPAPPEFIPWIFVFVGLGITSLAGVVAALKLRAARCLRERRSLTYCRFVAGLSCIEIPYGTVLGILSFLVLSRSSVQALFSKQGPELTAGNAAQTPPN